MAQNPTPPGAAAPPPVSTEFLSFDSYRPPTRRYALWGAMGAVVVVGLLAGLAWRHWQPAAPTAGTAEPGAAPRVENGVPLDAEVNLLGDAIVVRNQTTIDWPAGQVDAEARGKIYRTTFSSLGAGHDLRLSFAEFRTEEGEGLGAAGGSPEKVTIRAGGSTVTKELVAPPTAAPVATGVVNVPGSPTEPIGEVPPPAGPRTR